MKNATPYNLGMIGPDEIRAFLKREGLTQQQLAERIGVKQSTVSRWLMGQKPDRAQYEAIERLIGGRAASMKSGYTPEPKFLGQVDLKVYAAAEGGPGEMVISTDPIDLVPRPWYLGSVSDGYAVVITGESMIPAFRPGEMAIVHPRLPPVRGTDVILTQEREDGEFRATIKHLINWTPDHWKLEQFNPPEGQDRVFQLSRHEWPNALRVVGKYAGR